MLSTNKEKMDNAFEELCKEGSAENPDSGGAIYKAAYHAYFDKLMQEIPDSFSTDPDIADKLANFDGVSPDSVKSQLQQDAHDFAMFFTDAMDEILKEVSNQIDAHIKAIDFMIVEPVPNPTSGTTLVAGSIPVTGSILINTTAGSELTIM